jgi:hypothetical protein
MNELYNPLLVIIGAIVGSLSSIATVYVQGRLQNRRERTRLAVETAIQDQKHMTEHANVGEKIYPLSVWVFYHWQLIDLIARNKLTPNSMRKLQQLLIEMLKAVDEARVI